MNTNNGWLGIASAPKDESDIWTFNGEQGRMHWSEGDGWALWVWSDPILSDVDPAPDQPTHWMPLPAAPGTPPASAQDDAKDELATFSLPPTCSLQPVATAFFTEKGEVAYTGIYDRTLKALEAVKTTRMGISAGSIDLYTSAPAPAAGDARMPAINIEAAAKAMAKCMDYPWAHTG